MLGEKEVEEYLFLNEVDGHLKHEDYIKCPATAFLKFCIDAKDSIEHCKHYFPKIENNNNKLTPDSLLIIQHLVNSHLALLMGHFETYQKYLFAGLFERSIYLNDFNPNQFFRFLDNRWNQGIIQIDLIHLLGYRGDSAFTGVLLADSLKGWHEPEKVNAYIRAFGFDNLNFFSNEDIKDLNCLWQLRHSIVHTAATITKPDSQKNNQLSKYSGRNIVLSNKFIYELVKRMHTLVESANGRLKEAFIARFKSEIGDNERRGIEEFLDVESANRQWLGSDRVKHSSPS